jgi:radical SAM protein with 4Fe4S-binding SPASM domain
MKAAIDWLFDDGTSGTVEEVNRMGGLSFEPWGGEPLHNFEMLQKTYEYFVQKSKETGKKIRHIGGTTNGIEFTEERLKWMKERNITWLISMDGIKENHDSQRVLPNGKGSFDIIDKNIDLYKKVYGYAPQLRMSLHPDYINNLYKSYEYVLGKGIKSYFFSPVYEANWTEESYKELEEQLVKLYEKLIIDYKNGFPVIENKFVDDMIHYILEARRLGVNLDEIEKTGSYDLNLNSLSKGMHLPKPCGAGSTYFGVSVEGQIFICHRFNKHGLDPNKIPFEKRYGWLGNVWEGMHNIELFNELKNWDVKELEHCKYCKLKYYCKGSCYASNYDNSGDIKGKNDKSCKVNFALYNAALRIIDLFKQHGMYDERNHQIIYPQNNQYNNAIYIGKHGQQFDSCMCNNSTYYFDGLNKLLSDETPQTREELRMQIIDAGIHALLDTYNEIRRNMNINNSNNAKTQNANKKLQFNVHLPNV